MQAVTGSKQHINNCLIFTQKIVLDRYKQNYTLNKGQTLRDLGFLRDFRIAGNPSDYIALTSLAEPTLPD